MWILLTIAALFICVMVYVAISNSNQKKKYELELHSKGIAVGSRDWLDGGHARYIAFDQTNEFLIYLDSTISNGLKIIPIKDIQEVKLEKDGEIIYKKGVGNTLDRALVGGVLLGGVGAVVGAVTFSTNQIQKIKRLSLVTSGNSGANCYIHFVNRTTPESLKRANINAAEKWVNRLEDKLSEDVNQPTNP